MNDAPPTLAIKDTDGSYAAAIEAERQRDEVVESFGPTPKERQAEAKRTAS